MGILIDATPLVAIVIRNDPDHSRCVRSLEGNRQHFPFLTTMAVFTEAMHFAKKYSGWDAQEALWQMTKQGMIEIVEVTASDRDRMAALMKTYRDTPMDFADASLVALAERLGTHTVFTLDADFEVYRLPKKKSFTLLP